MKGDTAPRRDGCFLPLTNTHGKKAAVSSSRNHWKRNGRKNNATKSPSANKVLGSITNLVWKRASKLGPAIHLPPNRCRPKLYEKSYGQKRIAYQPTTGNGRHKSSPTFTLILLSGLTSLQAHCLQNACSAATSVFRSRLVKIIGTRRMSYRVEVKLGMRIGKGSACCS